MCTCSCTCMYVSIPLVHLMWWCWHTSIRSGWIFITVPTNRMQQKWQWIISEIRSPNYRQYGFHLDISLGGCLPLELSPCISKKCRLHKRPCVEFWLIAPARPPAGWQPAPTMGGWTRLQMIKAKLETQAFESSCWGLQRHGGETGQPCHTLSKLLMHRNCKR